jgi:hypothetical protein
MLTELETTEVSANPARRPHHQAGPRRAVAALGMFGVALIHTLDLPSKLHETPYIGVAYIGVIAASVAIAEVLIRTGGRRAWLAAAGLCASVIGGYVISRTTGMPNATEDVGNWFVEGSVLLLATVALAGSRGNQRSGGRNGAQTGPRRSHRLPAISSKTATRP